MVIIISDYSDKTLQGGGRLTNFRAKKWQPDWICTMSDDMANQRAISRGIFQGKKNGSLTWICTMSDDMANQKAISRGIFQCKKNGSLTWIRTKTK